MSGDQLSGCMAACAAIYRRSRRMKKASSMIRHRQSESLSSAGDSSSALGQSPPSSATLHSEGHDAQRHPGEDPLLGLSQRTLQQFAKALLSERGVRVLRGGCSASSRVQVRAFCRGDAGPFFDDYLIRIRLRYSNPDTCLMRLHSTFACVCSQAFQALAASGHGRGYGGSGGPSSKRVKSDDRHPDSLLMPLLALSLEATRVEVEAAVSEMDSLSIQVAASAAASAATRPTKDVGPGAIIKGPLSEDAFGRGVENLAPVHGKGDALSDTVRFAYAVAKLDIEVSQKQITPDSGCQG